MHRITQACATIARSSLVRFLASPLSPATNLQSPSARLVAHPRSCSAPSHRLSPPGSNRSRLRYTCDTEEKQPLINIAADHCRGEVLLDALDRGGRAGLEEAGFELLAWCGCPLSETSVAPVLIP